MTICGGIDVCTLCAQRLEVPGAGMCLRCCESQGATQERPENIYERLALEMDMVVVPFGKAADKDIKSLRRWAEHAERNAARLNAMAALQEKYNIDKHTPVG